jgi:penicillin-insensitive murein endopeptidase
MKMKPKIHKALRVVLILGGGLLLAGFAFIRWGNDVARAFEPDAPSQSLGSTKDGSLVNGKRLPTSGLNFRAYGRLPIALGRNSLNDRVRKVVVSTYAELEERRPGVTFVYAECGLPSGGRLRLHQTHRNGLSIDFMVPVLKASSPAVLNTGIANKYGYSLHFDTNGWCEAQQCEIDFDALSEHLHCLADTADAEGLSIWRVIFAPDLQPHLFATERGKNLKARLTFSKTQAWVRHDEHYHVDFHNPDQEEGQQNAPE